MAIIYDATLRPNKTELITAWLDRQTWGGTGPIETLGSYRFDDPDGEVGLEGFLVRREGRTLHVPLTYRGAPLAEAEDSLIGTTDHSVLGERWVYEATGDPLGRTLLVQAMHGQLEQATEEHYTEDKQFVETRQSPVRIAASGPLEGEDTTPLLVVHEPATDTGGDTMTISAVWPGGEGVLFRG